jgi:hypothetical protein
LPAGTALSARARLAGRLIALMIVLSVLHSLIPAVPSWPAGVLVWLIGALLLPQVSRYQKIQMAGMATVGAAGLGVAVLNRDFSWWGPLLEGNHPLLAMLAAVSFLRMVTRTGTTLGETLPTGRVAIYQTLLATHLFSAIINISAVFVIGQRIALDGSLTSLQARVISRAFVAAACWSPLFAAMAVVIHYIPHVDILAVAKVNLVLAGLLLGFTALELGRDRAAAEFVGFPVHREALTVPLILSALVLALYFIADEWSILTVIIVATASCLALMRLGQPLADTRRLFAHHIERELPRMGGEFGLFLGAAVLAAGIAALARQVELSLVIDPVQASSTIPLLFALVGLTLVGIHPVISVATLSGLFPPVLTAPDLMAIVVLMSWSIALGTSPFSGTTLAMQGRFGIPSVAFLRWNMPFTLVGLGCGSVLLYLLDH